MFAQALGRFLELSVGTPDIAASLDFYSKLGFASAEVGEAWRHPYAVVTDGRICLGLHQAEIPSPQLTFVKPDLLKFLDETASLGIDLEFRRLGSDVFNEIGWRDPSGHLIRLVEARTFSPTKPLADRSACGYFLEIGLPTQRIQAATSYWEAFGFVGMDETGAQPSRICCTSDTIDIGLYGPGELRNTALVFEVEDFHARIAGLAASGHHPARQQPASLPAASAAIFLAPEGTALLLCAVG